MGKSCGAAWPGANRLSYPFEDLVRAVQGHTMVDPERLRVLWNLGHRMAGHSIAGDFVECGSYKGGSAAVLRAAMGLGRRLWIYDSFQGMPPTTVEDGDEAKRFVGDCVGAKEDVIRILQATGAHPVEYTLLEGWFKDTFLKSNIPECVALLHCDADWYESVTLVLETFYDRVTPGGAIILDDFGYWEGCRHAYYDFCFRRGIKPLLERVGVTQAWWIKGLEHNRPS